MSNKLFLFLVALCVANIATIHGGPIAGNAQSKRQAQLEHLREELEGFRKELDEVLAGDLSSSSQVEAIAAPAESAEVEKKCDCDDRSDGIEKRCPNGCGQKKKTPAKTAAEVVVDAEKRCEGCVENDPEKRCPNGCGSKTRSKTSAPAAAPAPVQDSPIMKRFLDVLPVKDRQLIQRSGAKKQFIDRLLRRSHTGPNKEDMHATDTVATPEVSETEKRSLPVKDSSVMAAFKRGLSPAEQQLLKNHNSKAQAIRGLLERDAGSPKRAVDPVVAEYVQTLTEDEQLLLKAHPSVEDELKQAIQVGTNPESAKKRGLSQAQIEATINKLDNPSDKALVQKHLSKIENLAVAETRPVGGEEQRPVVNAKRKLSAAQIEATINKLDDANDRALVQSHLSKIENLAVAETRPVGAEEEANVVVSNLVKNIELAKKGGLSLDRIIDALKKRAAAAKHPVSLYKP